MMHVGKHFGGARGAKERAMERDQKQQRGGGWRQGMDEGARSPGVAFDRGTRGMRSWAVKGEGCVYLWSWRAVKDEGFVYLFAELGSEK